MGGHTISLYWVGEGWISGEPDMAMNHWIQMLMIRWKSSVRLAWMKGAKFFFSLVGGTGGL